MIYEQTKKNHFRVSSLSINILFRKIFDTLPFCHSYISLSVCRTFNLSSPCLMPLTMTIRKSCIININEYKRKNGKFLEQKPWKFLAQFPVLLFPCYRVWVCKSLFYFLKRHLLNTILLLLVSFNCNLWGF